jgi:peptidoglycan/xylan/chitin deacetylase (PgdA/CDA1 family)
MYSNVVTMISAILYYSGLVGLGRWWARQRGPRLIILNYHTATPGDLRQHLLYLRHHYRLLHLEDALEELFSSSSQKAQDRRTPLVITFDDGYYDNYTHCFALASELRIPITIFLIPGYIETGDRFWWLEPEYLVTHASIHEVTIEGQTYHLNKAKEREALTQAIDTRIRFASSVHEREAYLREVRELLGVPCLVTPEEKKSLLFSWKEVEDMKRSQWIAFGGHTMHHPRLACLTDPSEVEYEVCESRVELEHHLESSVRSFAYPFGKPGDIGEQAVRSVQKAGYSWAVTTVDGFNTPDSNPYLLHRYIVDAQNDWLHVAAVISGIWSLFANPLKMPKRFLQVLSYKICLTVFIFQHINYP